MLKTNQTKKGFTIIEVVLVLAIAGLIFLMVFIALPALQRNQKDTQRRQDYGDLSSAITQYMASNGRLPNPSSGSLDPSKYINKDGRDPDGFKYRIDVIKMKSGGGETGVLSDGSKLKEANANNTKVSVDGEETRIVYVVTKANCNGDIGGFSAPQYVNSTRSFAIYGFLEGGTYCQASE